jgi:hypothetical protein
MYIHDFNLCGGKYGPIVITLNFRNTLTYSANDIIYIGLKNAFDLPMQSDYGQTLQEILLNKYLVSRTSLSL